MARQKAKRVYGFETGTEQSHHGNDVYTVCKIRHMMAMNCHDCMYYESDCKRIENAFFNTIKNLNIKEDCTNENKRSKKGTGKGSTSRPRD